MNREEMHKAVQVVNQNYEKALEDAMEKRFKDLRSINLIYSTDTSNSCKDCKNRYTCKFPVHKKNKGCKSFKK